MVNVKFGWLVMGITGFFLVIGLLWMGLLKWYTAYMESFYAGTVLKIKDATTPDQHSKKLRLLKLFFYRQITYEFSAYAILFICILFLISSICVFLFANKFVFPAFNGIRLTTEQYLISLLSIRVGIALVIFFICQVLLRLYRYCLKFSAFYTGLFDALFIHEEIDKDLDTAIALFELKNMVDGNPKSPTEDIMAILKKMK